MDIELVKTCSCAPEQYNAYVGEKLVGYLRLRHGVFRVDFPDCGETTIYQAYPKGDGIFCEDEREGYLNEAKALLKEWVEDTDYLGNNPEGYKTWQQDTYVKGD